MTDTDQSAAAPTATGPRTDHASRGHVRSKRLTGLGPEHVLLAVALAGLAAGAALHLAGQATAGHAMWAATTTIGLAPAAWWVIDAARHRRLGADVIALLALVGTLVVGEYLAGAVIAVMLASGRTLEAWAAARSRRELGLLLSRAPRLAHRRDGDRVDDVKVEDVAVGDLVMVKPGEVVPVDGRVEAGLAVVDESALTGESLPVEHEAGDGLRSGTVNAGGPFDLRVTTTAAESTYAGIVRLVATAEASSAPSVRLADRYAGIFLVASLAVAGAAWGLSGQLARAVAVLVVATPCPLILAVPVALVSGLSRAARRGVVIKGGAVLERLARAKVLLFDKTGTLTAGRPTVADILTAGTLEANEVLRLAASLDQVSPHVLGAAIVRAARQRGLALALPEAVEEVAGRGVRGLVEGRTVAVGKAGWVSSGSDERWVRVARRRADRDGMLNVFVAVDGRPVGALLLEDPVRPDAARTIRRLRRDGIGRVVMVTGDRAEVAETVGAVIGVDEVLAERSPAEKVEAVTLEARTGCTVMVGDGLNDAPALALADVGVAIGARGATASSEAADVVLTVDRLDRLGEAVVIARRSLAIATQSVVAGIGLSVIAMAAAAAGFLPATWGALTQEAIDVAVILNALRVLRPGRGDGRLDDADADLARRFQAEHTSLRPDIEAVRAAADAIGAVPTDRALAMAREVHRLLVEEVGPHEEAEDAQLYPVLARVLGGTDPTGTMSRAHVEIAHFIRRLGRLLDDLGGEPDDDDLIELRRLLYGLHAILALHFAQEDEGYLSLADERQAPVGGEVAHASGPSGRPA
jgi:heavy metal translocating P-type ATPase